MSTTTEGATHACAVLISAEQQAEVAAAFVARQLTAGRRVVVLGLDAEAAALTRRLREDGTDASAVLATAQLSVPEAQESSALLALPDDRLRSWLTGLADTAADDGLAGLAVVTGSLVPRGDAHEASLDVVARACGVAVLCLYAWLLMDAESVTRVRAFHAVHLDEVALHDDGMLRITAPGPGVLRLAGELDLSNRAPAAAALQAATPDGGHLELDLASLRFVDAGGAGALLALAARPGADGVLRVRRARPAVLRVLRLVDLTGALRVVDGEQR